MQTAFLLELFIERRPGRAVHVAHEQDRVGLLDTKAGDVLEGIENFTGLGFRDSGFSGFAAPSDTPANSDSPDASDPQTFDKARQDILSGLSFTPTSTDELIRQAGLSVALAQTVLLELELAGRLQRLPGNRIVLLDE